MQEQFAHNGSAIITAGGNTAPAAGTSESWTASGSTLPSAATGTSQVHVSDPAQPGELMLVTNTSGTTLTVTRGAGGTTPVAHGTNFTIQNVIAADRLALYEGGSQYSWPPDYNLAMWSYDPVNTTGSVAPTAGQVVYVQMKAVDTRTVSTLWTYVNTAGATLTAGQNLIALYNSSGTQIGTCPDQSTAWTTTGPKQAALTAVGPGLGVVAGQFYYAALVCNGTTSPAFGRCNGLTAAGGVSSLGLTSAPYRFGKGSTGQTALPASFTPSGMAVDSAGYQFIVAVG